MVNILYISVPNFVSINAVAVEIFKKKTKKNTNVNLIVVLQEKSAL